MAATERTEPQLAVSGEVDAIEDHDEEGVLLYYKFVQIAEPGKTKTWLFDLSASLGLLGRIRVAADGVNVTVGGKMRALYEHIQLVGASPLFEGTDFKLAGSGVGNINHRVAAETGFTSLSARIVKELVTLGLPSSVELLLSMAGKHVTAQEFHKILHDSALETKASSRAATCRRLGVSPGHVADSPLSLSSVTASPEHGHGTATLIEAVAEPTQPKKLGGATVPKRTVVVDARNIYETRIGRFRPPQGVEVMDPMVRQYSDLPRWIDHNEDRLRNSKILMCCTGGVRCEMASAYIRSKGTEFEDVSQLSGGIQRYLEAFSDGGYFSGKNFVFDPRLAVPTSNQEIVGSCLLCSCPFDDYSSRSRCSQCRMLVLVCDSCQITAGAKCMCELCSEENRRCTTRRVVASQCAKGHIGNHEPEVPQPESRGEEVRQRKLKILCLHGFRQSASNLKGRLNALRKKLRQHVEFVYVDAPHEILCSPQQLKPSVSEVYSPPSSLEPTERDARKCFSTKFAWLICPAAMAGDAATGSPRSSTGNALLPTTCHRLVTQRGSTATHLTESMTKSPNFKLTDFKRVSVEGLKENPFATRGHGSDTAAGSGHSSTIPQSLQFRTQTGGWSRSWIHLKRVFTEQGPFDGVLGFSQGAAIAAALCIRRSAAIATHNHELVSFKFVILCSGFVSPALKRPQLGSAASIDCPSLHVFGGSSGLDRQIGVHESEELASLFQADKRMIVRHSMGHIIPTQPESVQQYLEFLSQFKT